MNKKEIKISSNLDYINKQINLSDNEIIKFDKKIFYNQHKTPKSNDKKTPIKIYQDEENNVNQFVVDDD